MQNENNVNGKFNAGCPFGKYVMYVLRVQYRFKGKQFVSGN
jgi:hypothetical protein